MSTRIVLNILLLVALVPAVVACFVSLSFGIMAVVTVVLTDIFCYALIIHSSKRDLIRLGAVTAFSWIVLIFA